jgi:hypothetical protein
LDEADDPALLARLEMPAYRAQVERAIVLTVEAYDWNCPRHITPRFTAEEVQDRLVAPLQARVAELERENAELRAAAVSHQPPKYRPGAP